MDRKQHVSGNISTRQTARPRRSLAFLSAGSRVLNCLYVWQARIDERRELACIGERLLKDAGFTRIDVMREASKPFWRA
mgnify:CR=1 FL=1